jgi:predicted nucleic acid-binding protein
VILADTSVWVDHLRHANARMASLLKEGEIAGHTFVIEELALGHRSGYRRSIGVSRRLRRASDWEIVPDCELKMAGDW